MGYYSSVENMSFGGYRVGTTVTEDNVKVSVPVTVDDLKEAFLNYASSQSSSNPEDLWEELEYFLVFNISDGLLEIDSTGESGKAYGLERAVKLFVESLEDFGLYEDNPGGLDLSFEVHGETNGDMTLYFTQGYRLKGVQAEIVFDRSKAKFC